MADLFSSAKSTLRRAQHHIYDLGAKLNAVTRNKPWAYDIERDLDGVTEVHKIKIAERFSDDLPCVVFDVVNNLRACLDQTSYAACIGSGRADTEFGYFPFAKHAIHLPNKLNGVCAKNLVRIALTAESLNVR